mgnify:CR=1 FL=1
MPSGEIDNARPAGPRLYDYIIILITVTIWGGSFASTKYALAQAEPSLILLLRFLFGIPVLAAGCLFEKSLRLPTKEEAVILLLIGFQGIFFHQGIQAVAMKTAGAGNANWMMVASPAIVARSTDERSYFVRSSFIIMRYIVGGAQKVVMPYSLKRGSISAAWKRSKS